MAVWEDRRGRQYSGELSIGLSLLSTAGHGSTHPDSAQLSIQRESDSEDRCRYGLDADISSPTQLSSDQLSKSRPGSEDRY